MSHCSGLIPALTNLKGKASNPNVVCVEFPNTTAVYSGVYLYSTVQKTEKITEVTYFQTCLLNGELEDWDFFLKSDSRVDFIEDC